MRGIGVKGGREHRTLADDATGLRWGWLLLGEEHERAIGPLGHGLQDPSLVAHESLAWLLIGGAMDTHIGHGVERVERLAIEIRIARARARRSRL